MHDDGRHERPAAAGTGTPRIETRIRAGGRPVPCAGTAPVERTFVRYEPAAPDPDASLPAAFGHVAAGGTYATTVERHAADGSRVTHGLVTGDPAGYGALRPAQLFGAPFWSPPAAGEPVPHEALTTTLTPSLVRECVLAHPGGAAMLPALVSALELAGRPGGPRVVLLGTDLARVVEWLVAGTLLLPRAQALALGFAVFAGPATAGVPVVGVHPDDAPDLVAAVHAGPPAAGYAVFDLTTGAFTGAAATRHAERWVGLFLDHEPREVVDAVDVAAACGLEPDAAAALASAAVLGREPGAAHALAVAGWLRTGPEELRRRYATGIAAAFGVAATDWPLPVLAELDAAGAAGHIPGQAAEVRLALLRAETDAAALRAQAGDRAPAPLPAGEWTAAENSAARRVVLAALNAGPAPEGFEALLRLAARYGMDVQPADLADRGRDLVEHWADHPGAGYDPDRWPCGDRLAQALVDELARRVKAVPGRRRDVGTGWWRWLLPRLDDLEPPLAEVVLAGAVQHGEDRAGLVQRQLTGAAHDPDLFLWTAAALFGLTPPTVAELRLVKRLAPAGVVLPPPVLDGLVARLVGDAPLSEEDVEVGHLLVDAGLVPRHRLLFQLLADDRVLRAVVRRLTMGPATGDGPAVVLLHELEELPARLVSLRAAEVAAALAVSAPPRELLAVLRRHPGVVEHYVALLSELLRKPGDERHAVVAYHLMHNLDSRGLRPVLTAPVLRWVTRASSRQLHRVGELIAGFGPAWSASWEGYLEHVRGHRRMSRLIHPFGGH
ncbi:GTPase-associated protein 1-related protein [Dactylosporangium sp. NPDC050688]|uniref:GTPase-associated protein 1-related protein n=1 Tax=Dactylosporangium sp. NPDC050688 TaxID=3157217 RepID=UPI0033D2B380